MIVGLILSPLDIAVSSSREERWLLPTKGIWQGLWSQSGGHKENIEEKYPKKDLKEVASSEKGVGRGIGRDFPQEKKETQPTLSPSA